MVNDLVDSTSDVWVPVIERARVVDFSVPQEFMGQHYIMDVGRGTRTDWKLFFRPFHGRVWAAGSVTVVLAFAAYQFASGLGPFDNMADSQALKILAFSGWTFWTLAKSYWEAALTMFFTTPKDLPFSSVEVRPQSKRGAICIK